MKRGTVFWVNLGPSIPPEFGKTRPAIVISNSEQNLTLPSIVVLPLSTRGSEIWPLRLEMKVAALKRSFAILPGIRQINKDRIEQVIDNLEFTDLEKLDAALLAYLRD